jgi:hypothetical protein
MRRCECWRGPLDAAPVHDLVECGGCGFCFPSAALVRLSSPSGLLVPLCEWCYAGDWLRLRLPGCFWWDGGNWVVVPLDRPKLWTVTVVSAQLTR